MKQVKQAIHYWCDDVESGRYLGQGIGVAVLDSGIVLHPDFDNRIIAFQDIVGERYMLYDDNGHGTHVAGIIAGNGQLSNGIYAGIAPRSNMIAIKVLDQKGNGKVYHVLKGIRWVLENQKRYKIRIVNISVGTLPQSGDHEEEQLVEAVETLWEAGIVVVAAAGNYGPGAGTITTPGISKKIITVGSSNDQFSIGGDGNPKKDYSGRGPTRECVCKPDVVAPGSYIIACNAYYLNKGNSPYTIKSGTSMATPVVAGAIAVLLSKYPDMSNVEVKLRLRERCLDLRMKNNQQGWGIIQLENLLEA